MNDRLLKLYESAHIVDGQLTNRLDVEKFAQLIVADCVALCKYDTEDDDDLYDLGMIYKAKEIRQLIKKHFGVE
jgi:hypothetical protein